MEKYIITIGILIVLFLIINSYCLYLIFSKLKIDEEKLRRKQTLAYDFLYRESEKIKKLNFPITILQVDEYKRYDDLGFGDGFTLRGNDAKDIPFKISGYLFSTRYYLDGLDFFGLYKRIRPGCNLLDTEKIVFDKTR